METINRSVTTACMKREDAVTEIIRLYNKGYRHSEISVYSNSDRAKAIGRLMGIEVEDLEVPAVEDEQRWWQSFKTAFLSDTQAHHSEMETPMSLAALNNGLRAKPIDCLNPYEKELASGKLVIVVDNYGSHTY